MDLLKIHLTIIVISGYLKNLQPLSTLILAWQEHAKSEEVLKLKNIGCLVISDCTAWGLQRLFGDEEKKSKKRYHHVIIPDMERLNARGGKVKAEILAVFKLLMAEGIGLVRTKYINFDMGKNPYKCGFIMCVTPDDMHPLSAIHNISFLSRLIPFSYEFSNGDKQEILEFILSEKNRFLELSKITSKSKLDVILPDKYKPDIKLKAEHLADIMNQYCCEWERYEITLNGVTKTDYRKVVKGKLFGTRAETYYMTYIKAIAIKNHPKELTVNDTDYEEFKELEEYFNFNMHELKNKKIIEDEPITKQNEPKKGLLQRIVNRGD